MDPNLTSFSQWLDKLRDWPDKAIIMATTKMAEQYVRLAGALSNIVTSRLTSPSLNPTFKLPLFYLMDSIMKNVGGPYASLFCSQLSEIHAFVFRDIPTANLEKLKFLLETWRERGLIPAELLLRMNKSLLSGHEQTIKAAPQQLLQQQMNKSVVRPPSRFSSAPRGAPTLGQCPLSYPGNTPLQEDVIRQEMGVMVNKMYQEMNITNPMTLDTLATANPTLYAQIRAQAEAAVSSANQGTGQQQQLAGVKRSISVSSSGTTLQGPAIKKTVAIAMGLPDDDYDKLQPENLVRKTASISSNLVNGFLCEASVIIDVNRVKLLANKMRGSSSINSSNTTLADSDIVGYNKAAHVVTKRLDGFLENVSVPPSLPPILFGLLPLEPVLSAASSRSSGVNGMMHGNVRVAAGLGEDNVAIKRPVPKFRPEELGRNPERGVRALYAGDQYHEDGLRFLSLKKLQKHTDAFLEQKKLLRKKKDSVREFREWFCTAAQWVSDFNALQRAGSTNGDHGSGVGGLSVDATRTSGLSENGKIETPQEELICPADENFIRCPISKEVFENVWDEDEGEYMYRNAVKILITEDADAAYYKLGKPTAATGVRYIIVQKLLVLDSLLEQGKAATLSEVIERYMATGAKSRSAGIYATVEKLKEASVGDHPDDIFVMLEPLA